LLSIFLYTKLTKQTQSAGRDSAVGIATRYGLDGPVFETRREKRLSIVHPWFGLAMGHTQPLIQRVPALFPGVKGPGRGVDDPFPSSAEVKERVQLHLYSLVTGTDVMVLLKNNHTTGYGD
jgi:hypothetical protein